MRKICPLDLKTVIITFPGSRYHFLEDFYVYPHPCQVSHTFLSLAQNIFPVITYCLIKYTRISRHNKVEKQANDINKNVRK
jgi:hypothetical protein